MADPNVKPAPASANAVIATAYDDHQWKQAPLDPNTTDGIQRMLKAHGAAIQALADYIDGVKDGKPLAPKAP